MDKPTKEQEQWLFEQCGLEPKLLWGDIDYETSQFSPHEGRKEKWDTEQRLCFPDTGQDSQGRTQAWWQEIPHIASLEFLGFLFKYAPDTIVGIYFRYYPGGCECLLTYITEAGFDTVKSWVKNETGDEKKSRELSALALFWAVYSALGGQR